MPADDLSALIDSFTHDLASLIRKAAIEAVHGALGAAHQIGSQAGPKAARKAPVSAKGVAARRHGEKRDPKELEALTQRLGDYIKAHPGERIEQINKALGVATKELALPIKKLIACKAIKSKGQKRSTTYYPVGAGWLVQAKRAKRPADAKAEPTAS